MKNHPQLDEMITERDQEALKHLTNIGLEYLDDTHAFRLNFEFAANDYFTNKVLTKTYHYQTNADIGDIVFHRAEGDTIQWKDGKDLTVALESRKQRNKATNETRVVKKSVPTDSFFLFFRNSDVPDESVDDEVAAELQEQVEADYEIGEEFKEKIIPHAVDWFTGRALEYEGFDMEDFEDDGEDFYGEDSEDEDDDDFEDDEEDRKVRL
ncbi:histone chaperone [Dimargaris verticillata]|uniref:Histone chaperone n=1 Tax=Dimargaris verticillata TaxID=2761393 RepID=A0A9W8EAF5_9FUNG|nr:histone chaperone [Dimargaris verticillata]